MRGRTALVVSGVLLALLVAGPAGEIEPALVPGTVGLFVGAGAVSLESLTAESWRTRSLEVGVAGGTIGAIGHLSGGPELFFCIVALAALIVVQSAVMVRDAGTSSDGLKEGFDRTTGSRPES